MFDAPPVQIVPFQPGHEAEVRRLADRCLGDGYLGDLSPVLSRPGLVFGVALATGGTGAEGEGTGGDIAGFVFGWRLAAGELDGLYPALRDQPRPEPLLRAEAAGHLAILKTIAVDPAWQGRGLGGELFRGCAQRLRLDGADGLVVPAWTIAGRPNLGPVLTREGFHPFAELPRPWAEDCDRHSFTCHHRSQDEGCICGLRLYGKPV